MRIKILLPGLIAAVFFAAAASERGALAAAPSAESQLDAIARRYYQREWQFNPAGATETGVHDYDSRLGSYAAADFNREIAVLHATKHEVEALPAASLSLDGQIDRQLLDSAIQQRLFEVENQRAWRRDPGMYPGIASFGIYTLMVRNFAPADVRLRLAISREKRIPAVLASGKANIQPSQVSAVAAQVALLDTQGAVDFFQHEVPEAFASVTDSALLAEFKSASAAAVAALRDYAHFIASSVVPKAHAPYAIGRSAYQRLEDLQNAKHIPLDKLLAVGEADLAKNKAAYIATAAQIDPKAPPGDVEKELDKGHPAADQLINVAQQQLNDLVAFIKAKHIIDLPDAPIAKVVPTPKFAAQLSFASMDSPGPLETRATEAYYHVTLVDPKWTKQQAEEHLAFFNKYHLLLISAHEAYPGHHTNYLFNKRANLSLVRQIEWNPAFGEGWAHYDEQMMVDEGVGGGDPRYRLAQLTLALQRDCRYVVGIKEHTQGMTVDQATRFFMGNAFMPRQAAYREALRGTQDPLYGYYTLGKLMILKLRADYQAKMGAQYTLAKFHDELMSHGDPPLYFLRKLLLGPDDKGSLL